MVATHRRLYMRKDLFVFWLTLASLSFLGSSSLVAAAESTAGPADTPPKIPRFSTNYMDRSVQPSNDFYQFADGAWVKNNPIPPDKSRWGGFMELQERNWFLIHE